LRQEDVLHNWLPDAFKQVKKLPASQLLLASNTAQEELLPQHNAPDKQLRLMGTMLWNQPSPPQCPQL